MNQVWSEYSAIRGGGVGVGGVKNENFLKNAQNGLKHLENEFGVILSTFIFLTKMAATENLGGVYLKYFGFVVQKP